MSMINFVLVSNILILFMFAIAMLFVVSGKQELIKQRSIIIAWASVIPVFLVLCTLKMIGSIYAE